MLQRKKKKRVLGVGPSPTTHLPNDPEAGSPKYLPINDSICMMRELNLIVPKSPSGFMIPFFFFFFFFLQHTISLYSQG